MQSPMSKRKKTVKKRKFNSIAEALQDAAKGNYMPTTEGMTDEQMRQVISDQLMFGRSVTYVSKDGIKVLHPLTDIEKLTSKK